MEPTGKIPIEGRVLQWNLDEWAIVCAAVGEIADHPGKGIERAFSMQMKWRARFCHQPGRGDVGWQDPEPDYEQAHELLLTCYAELSKLKVLRNTNTRSNSDE